MRAFAAAPLLLVLLLPDLAVAQKGVMTQPAARPQRRGAFAVTVLSTRFTDPIFRTPSEGGGPEVPTTLSASIMGYRVSWLFRFTPRAAVELGGSYFSAGFQNTRASDGGSGWTYEFQDPKIRLWFVDIGLGVRPIAGVPLEVSGILGMGQERESYTVTDAPFAEWTGPKTLTEFNFSYGLAVALAPIRQLALVADFRLVPGDLSSSGSGGGGGDVCYTVIYYRLEGSRSGSRAPRGCGSGSFENHAKLLSAGLRISLP